MGTFTEDKEKISNGKIWAYWYDPTIQQEGRNESQALQQVRFQNFDTKGFHPLGIEYHTPSSRLFTVSHHYDGSRIEVFDLNSITEVGIDGTKDPSSPLVAKHIKTIISDTLPAPNAIAAINDHELYITNDHLFPRRFYPRLSALETFLGISGGGIVYVNIETNEVRKIAHVPFANGISFLNATTLATSSTSTASVRLFDVSAESLEHSLKETSRIDVPFFPDNLSVDEEGILHIAGHPSMKALEQAERVNPSVMRAQRLHGYHGGAKRMD
ncbi:hypothetical protein KEM56_000040 [Ascosphaera pollenicola]|nr:hypothetical protein KEM56_000040 [Ascosphaera pollenicola]